MNVSCHSFPTQNGAVNFATTSHILANSVGNCVHMLSMCVCGYVCLMYAGVLRVVNVTLSHCSLRCYCCCFALLLVLLVFIFRLG